MLNASAADPPDFATGLARAFVAAACDGEAGRALHSMLAPDALVYRSGTWRSARAESPDAFAAAHHELHARAPEALPRFVGFQPLDWQADSAGDTGVAWFAAVESRTARAVIGALGVRRDDDWRVSWATLADRLHDWTFADGRARTLAQFAWMTLREPAAARTTLDASWFRLHWLPDPALRALPNARFSCRASTTCCRQDYTVAVPEAARSLIESLPWERIAPHLGSTELRSFGAGLVEIKARGEPCRFIGRRNECLIHAELGYQPFGPCAAFPFSFAATPDGIDVSASLTCGSVCHGVGEPLAAREQDLRQRLAIAAVRATSVYRLAPDQAIDGRAFLRLEERLRVLLGRDDLPLYRRLQRGVRSLAAALAARPFASGAPDTIDPADDEPLAPLAPELHGTIGAFLDRILQWDRLAFAGLSREIPRDLRHAELRGAERLARTLGAIHFGKTYSYEFDLVTAHNCAIITYLLALGWQRQFPDGLDELRWNELVLLGGHGLLKSLLGADAAPAYRALLGSTEFGEWLLAFARP